MAKILNSWLRNCKKVKHAFVKIGIFSLYFILQKKDVSLRYRFLDKSLFFNFIHHLETFKKDQYLDHYAIN